MHRTSFFLPIRLFPTPVVIPVLIAVAGTVLSGCSSPVKRDVVEKYSNGRPKKVIDRIDGHRYYEREIGQSGELTKQKFFIDGAQDSFETVYNAEGRKLSEIMFSGGKRNGVTHEYHSNGRIAFEGNCADDRFEGMSTWYYNNGRVQTSGGRHLSLDTGRWNYFDTAGALVKAAWYGDSSRTVYYNSCGEVIPRQKWDSMKIMEQGR